LSLKDIGAFVFLKRHFFYLISFFLLSDSLAQTKNDSLRHVSAPPITVSSNAFTNEVIRPADIHIESSNILSEKTGALRLAEALPILHPSLDVRNYGSLGGISLASFRGLPSEYTSVYWEGIKLTDQQKSLSDLALIDMRSVQSVGVITAANSQLMGGDFGVGILLHTDMQQSGITIGGITSSYDNFSSLGEKEGFVTGSINLPDSLALFGGITSSYSNGAFPFFQQSTHNTILRQNNDAHLFNAHAGVEYVIDESINLKALSFFTKAERGAPGAVTTDNTGASDLSARQSDENFLTAISLHHEPLTYFNYTINLGYNSQYETYRTPNFNIDDHYLNRSYSFVLKSQTNLNDWAKLYGGLDYSRNLLFSNQNIRPDKDSIISRESYAGYLAAQTLILEHFDFIASLRTELQSDINKAQILPGLSLHYIEPATMISFQASYGRLYHAPTFNELYWRVGGNPNLLPESGHTSEISLQVPLYPMQSLAMDIKLTLFENNFTNQIIWTEGTQGFSVPSQISTSRSRGLEFTGEARYELGNHYQFLVREGLSFINAKNLSALYNGKLLPYSAPMRSSFLVEFRHDDIGSLSLSALYRAHRYKDFYNLILIDPMIKYDLTFSSNAVDLFGAASSIIRFSVLNFTNEQYEEVPNYPLPGRSFRLSIEFHFL
jgi:vitamin B12 transporter